jgi:DNA-binding CsgD family transcriptional regulator/tetratricopeptide (TPR) repeat protein
MKHILVGIILAFCAPLVYALPAGLPGSNGELLELLDTEIKKRGKYEEKHRFKIDSLRRSVPMTTDKEKLLSLYRDLGKSFHVLNADSAIIYYTKGIEIGKELGDSAAVQRLFIMRASEFRKLGAALEGLNDLEHVKSNGILNENLDLFYDVGREISFSMSALYPYTEATRSFEKQGLDFAHKEIEFLVPGSLRYMLCQALIHMGEGDSTLGVAVMNDILEKGTMLDHEFPLAATFLGEYYVTHGQLDSAVYYFALGALSDVYRANRHGTALLRLGEILYSQNQTVRAHNYLSVALENALLASAKMNATMISKAFMPVVNDIQQYNNRRFLMLGFLSLCLVVALILIARMYISKRREMAVVQSVRFSLAEANRSKETYMSQFMNLYSSYMESLEEFNRMCRRKITAGQSEDLLQFIKSGKVMADQRKKFYDIFDDSFLHIYPTFVQDVNALLVPDKRINITAPGVLTTELRILAFMRLGVEDTSQVARFLGLSLNTIYTYRNKMRTRALNRDNFEEMIMKIGAIE